MNTFYFMATVANSRDTRYIRDCQVGKNRAEALMIAINAIVERGADIVSIQSCSEAQYRAAVTAALVFDVEFSGHIATEVLNPV